MPTITEDRKYSLSKLDYRKPTNQVFYLSSVSNDTINWPVVTLIALLSLVLGTVYLIVSFVLPTSSSGITFPISESPLGIYKYASVAADAAECSKIGTDILARGGHAVDAAIAAAVCSSVYNIHSSGIGGGFLMTIWDNENQKAYAVDARETAPLQASKDMFNDGKLSSLMGGSAIGVPGEVAGYWEVHQKFGKYSWKKLFEPSINICNEGFTVNAIVESAIDEILLKINQTEDQSIFKDMINFLNNTQTGKPYRAGETMICPMLSKTLQKIGSAGGDSFYNGSLSKDIIEDLMQSGAIIDESDLQIYKVKWREPISTWVQNKSQLLSVPPPGSGPAMAIIMNILAGYNMTETDSQSDLSYHRIIEAMKFAYGQTAHLGDESFVPGMTELVGNISSPSFGDYLREQISDSMTHPTEYYQDQPIRQFNKFGTSHVSVVDSFGNAVSITSTINHHFGSGVVGNRTGVIFNNQMNAFSIPVEDNPNSANFIFPQKRPMSSMCPAILVHKLINSADTTVKLVIGGSGGSRIQSATGYVATRILWFKEDPKLAVDALRFHHQLIPEQLLFEQRMPSSLLASLQERGHVNQTDYKGLVMSNVNAIHCTDDGTIQSISDFRKYSTSEGF